MAVEDEVRAAAAAIVEAFGTHDRSRYFSLFAPHCTFLFYNSNEVLTSRAAYERAWDEWVVDGFHVNGCVSTYGQVHMAGPEVAVFTHTVRTRLADGDGEIETGERETIVFERIEGRWMGVHEHLSADPNFSS